MTEEEKKAKLEELRERLAAKRAAQLEQEKIDKKRNEVLDFCFCFSFKNVCGR